MLHFYKNALSLIFLLIATASFAWGHKGHTLVAETAFHYLDAKTKANVMKYLDGMTLAQAANWMDAIKSDKSKNFMKPWHYINLEKGAKTMPEGDNIVTMLNKTIKELGQKQNLNDEEIKTKLLILFHLVGDLHQPLHVGYPEDKGGNKIQVNFYGKGTNLHSIWDTEIIENQNLSLQDILRMNTYSSERLSEIREINVFKWTGESRAHLKNAYAFKGNRLDVDYIHQNTPIVKTQLLNAGLRLAAVLEQCFKEG